MNFPAADQPYPDQQPDDHQPVAAPGGNRIEEVLLGLAVAVAMTVLGAPLGWLWSTYAPHARKIVLPDGPLYLGEERLIGGEGWYVFATIGAGIVLASVAWLVLRPFRGPAVLLGLAVGGIGGGLMMYATGHRIGAIRADFLLNHSPVGTIVRMPVDLGAQRVGLWHGWLPFAQGDVLCMAIAAVLVYLVLAGFSPYPTLRPPPPAEDFSSGY